MIKRPPSKIENSKRNAAVYIKCLLATSPKMVHSSSGVASRDPRLKTTALEDQFHVFYAYSVLTEIENPYSNCSITQFQSLEDNSM